MNGLAAHMAGVTYPTGHRDTLEVAVRRAVLTGVNQTAGKLQVARMEEMDWGFVEVSAHAGARPEHAKWQGRQYHRGGAVTYNGKYYPDFERSTGYGTGAGLCGWNCRHTFFAIDPDLSEPAYTEAELAALDAKNIEYKGKLYSRYEISQKQRALERKVRAAKKAYLAEDAAGLDTTQSAVKLRQARQNLSAFVRETNSRNDSARTFVSGFGRSEASRATAQARGYAKEQERAIMVENLRKAGNFRKAAQIHLTPTSIDADALGFDDAHINAQRSHRVTEAQAKQWIRDAKISVTVWNGQYEHYYAEQGAVYVNLPDHFIRTAFSAAEYTDNIRALMEAIKENGL